MDKSEMEARLVAHRMALRALVHTVLRPEIIAASRASIAAFLDPAHAQNADPVWIATAEDELLQIFVEPER